MMRRAIQNRRPPEPGRAVRIAAGEGRGRPRKAELSDWTSLPAALGCRTVIAGKDARGRRVLASGGVYLQELMASAKLEGGRAGAGGEWTVGIPVSPIGSTRRWAAIRVAHDRVAASQAKLHNGHGASLRWAPQSRVDNYILRAFGNNDADCQKTSGFVFISGRSNPQTQAAPAFKGGRGTCRTVGVSILSVEGTVVARVWKEPYNPGRHCNHMWPVEYPRDRLVKHWVYFVEVCGFTFEFHSLDQITACREHYARKVRPGTREPMGMGWGGDEREARDNMLAYHWYDRLPQYLLEEPKRARVVAALGRAVAEFGPAGGPVWGQ